MQPHGLKLIASFIQYVPNILGVCPITMPRLLLVIAVAAVACSVAWADGEEGLALLKLLSQGSAAEIKHFTQKHPQSVHFATAVRVVPLFPVCCRIVLRVHHFVMFCVCTCVHRVE